jgi:segregation and condensation protein A
MLATNLLGSAYRVELPAFQGPLDLLLRLIETEKLEISQVSLVVVTDSYVKTLEQLEEVEPGALADFLVVASRLLHIKSLSLLPQPRPKDEEEEEDAGEALVRQLMEYRQFKTVAALLKQRQELGLRAYIRSEAAPQLEKRLDLSNVDLAKLQAAMRKALQRLPNEPQLPTLKTYTITLAQQIENVRQMMRQLHASVLAAAVQPPTLAFSELLGRSHTRLEVIVTFLAVLELIKQGELTARQENVFGEIVLETV